MRKWIDKRKKRVGVRAGEGGENRGDGDWER